MSECKINPVQKEDLLSVADLPWIEWDKFRGKKIAVTGATGLIGKNLIFALLEANVHYGLDCQILAFVRNVSKAKEIFGQIDEKTLVIVQQDVMCPVPEVIEADYLVHCASITTSKMMVENPVETIMTTVEGTRNMLAFAARCKMEGVVYVSSMEAYGTVDPAQGEVREENLGYIDLTNVRNGYSEGKRMAECLCAAFASEYGVNVRIARLAQTFGAGVAKDENRVFAQFARSVLKGEDIILHTKGDKANCYCYTSDAVSGLLVLLTKGENGQAYNVANMGTFCSIRQLAETFLQFDETKQCRLRIEIPENVASLGYAPSSILRLNSEKLMALGWIPDKNMQDMACRLLESMKID